MTTTKRSSSKTLGKVPTVKPSSSSNALPDTMTKRSSKKTHAEESKKTTPAIEKKNKSTEDAATLPAKKKKKKKTTPKPTINNNNKNVLYIGHIPDGFVEVAMRSFLSQFGKVLKVRISRSKTTGKPRGYGFVQLRDESVAKIVQKTLHGYILMGRTLVCQFVPEEHVHPLMFKGGLTRDDQVEIAFKNLNWHKIAVHQERAAEGDEEAAARRAKRLRNADEEKRKRLKVKGIDYEFAGYGQGESEVRKEETPKTEKTEETTMESKETTTESKATKKKKTSVKRKQ